MVPTDLRAILKANVWRMIELATPKGERPSVRAWALGRGLEDKGVRLIDRIVKGEHAIGLDKLDEIARACNLPAWQLLLPPDQFDPTGSSEAPITADERKLLGRLRKLLST